MTNKTKALLALALVALVVMMFANPVLQTSTIMLQPGDTRIVERGEQIYAVQCASCHGVDLQGQPDWRTRKADGRLPAPPHDETGHTWHHTDDMIFNSTKFGPQYVAGPDYQSDMPAYDGVISDDDIVAVLSYIKSRWPAEIRTRHDDMNNRAASQ